MPPSSFRVLFTFPCLNCRLGCQLLTVRSSSLRSSRRSDRWTLLPLAPWPVSSRQLGYHFSSPGGVPGKYDPKKIIPAMLTSCVELILSTERPSYAFKEWSG